MSQIKHSSRERKFNTPLLFWVLFGPSMGWVVLIYIEEANLLHSIHFQMGISSGDALTDTPRKKSLTRYFVSCGPVKLTQY